MTPACRHDPVAVTEAVQHHADATFDATVIVINYNAGAYLCRCLEALAAQSLQPAAILVVDNASEDGSADVVAQQFQQVLLIRNPRNLGFAAANNLALRHAPVTRWVITLNPDAFPRSDWLAELAHAATIRPDCAMFACRLLQADDPTRLDGAGDDYHVTGLAWRHGHGRTVEPTDPSREVFGPCAAAAMYRRDRLLAAGGFDEDFFCYMEDVDLAFRLRLLGERCWYLPRARVLHIGSGVTGYRSDFSTYHGHRNMVWVFFKNMPAGLLWRYLPGFLLINLIALWIGLQRRQFRVVVRAKHHALRGMAACWRKRRSIQARRRVTDAALKASFVHGWWTLIQRHHPAPERRRS